MHIKGKGGGGGGRSFRLKNGPAEILIFLSGPSFFSYIYTHEKPTAENIVLGGLDSEWADRVREGGNNVA